MNEDDILSRLDELGFTEYQSQSYLAAVRLGSAQPRTLAEESGVPQSRIYDVIDDLRELGLVEVHEASGSKTVIASPPDMTLEDLRDRRVAELTDTVDSVVDGLESLHDRDESQSRFVTMVGLRKTALRHVERVIESAEWWVSLALPLDLYREVQPAIEDALDRGVTVRLVVPASNDASIQAVEFPAGVQVRTRLLADVLAIADRHYGVFSSLSATEESPPYVIVQDENLVFLLQNFFDHFWPVSTELQSGTGYPRRYLDPWRAIKELKDGLDAGDTFEAIVSGYHNEAEHYGTWEGTIVDYALEGPVEADYTVALPTKANLFAEVDGEVLGVGGQRATRMDVAADGIEVVSRSG